MGGRFCNLDWTLVKIRRVARISQRGGRAFLEVWSNRKRTWPKFSFVLNWIEAIFQWKLGDLLPPPQKKKGLRRNSKAFSGWNQIFKGLFPAKVISKKKGLRRSLKAFFGRNQIFKGFFSGQKQVISKKKKVFAYGWSVFSSASLFPQISVLYSTGLCWSFSLINQRWNFDRRTPKSWRGDAQSRWEDGSPVLPTI